MNYKLILLSEHNIIVSDEIQTKGCEVIHKTTYRITKCPDEYSSTQEHWYKVIAGLPGLPTIDYNGLEEKFGIVETLFKQYLEKRYSTMGNSHLFDSRECKRVFKDAFKAAQALHPPKEFDVEIEKSMSQCNCACHTPGKEMKHLMHFTACCNPEKQIKIV
jgi:hypothetical protein